MKISKTKLATFIAGVLCLSLVVGSWAYYSSVQTINNEMSTSKYGSKTVENFPTPPTLEPGAEVTKVVGVANTGDYDLVVRIKMNEIWWDDDNGNGEYDEGEERIAISSADAGFFTVDKTTFKANQYDFDGAGKLTGATDGIVKDADNADESVVYKYLAETGWTYNAADGYWYYNTRILPGAETSALMTGLKFAADMDMGNYATTQYYSTAASDATKTAYDKRIEARDAYNTAIAAYAADATAENEAAMNAAKANFEEKDAAFEAAIAADGGWTTDKPEKYTYTKSESSLTDDAGYANAKYTLTVTTEVCQATQEAVNAVYGGGAAFTPPTGTSWGLK